MIRKGLILLTGLMSLFGCAKECELVVYNKTPIQQTVKIDGIIYANDESDRTGMRIVFAELINARLMDCLIQ